MIIPGVAEWPKCPKYVYNHLGLDSRPLMYFGLFDQVFHFHFKFLFLLQVPERVLKTIRVSVSTRKDFEQRVRIGVLVTGDQDEVGFSEESCGQ